VRYSQWTRSHILGAYAYIAGDEAERAINAPSRFKDGQKALQRKRERAMATDSFSDPWTNVGAQVRRESTAS
jgi:hypothetical protein